MEETHAPQFWKGSFKKMPGHWLLATMGKKVLRPGGLELSTWMIQELNIGIKDEVVEFAPGLGRTAQLTLQNAPLTYTGIEQNEEAAEVARKAIGESSSRAIRVANAHETGLPDQSATVAYGEAFLTMQSTKEKEKILKEIARVLKPGGHYGMHELTLATDDQDLVTTVQKELSKSILVNAKPLTVKEWQELLLSCGFEIVKMKKVPMTLLEPKRLLADEGVKGVSKITTNLLKHPTALMRVLQMRKSFQKRADVLQAISIVAQKSHQIQRPGMQVLGQA